MWYGELLGNQARFANHPGGVGGSPGCIGDFPGDPNVVGHTGSCFEGTIVTEDGEHPTTEDLPARWDLSDERDNFQANPRSTVHVLQTLDESSNNFQPHPFIRNWGTLMGADHPITWCQVYDGGRVWYTGIGHDAAAYANEDSMGMIFKGIQWAGGRWGLQGLRAGGLTARVSFPGLPRRALPRGNVALVAGGVALLVVAALAFTGDDDDSSLERKPVPASKPGPLRTTVREYSPVGRFERASCSRRPHAADDPDRWFHPLQNFYAPAARHRARPTSTT